MIPAQKEWFIMEEIEKCLPLLSVDGMVECVDVYKHGLPKGTVNETVVKGEGYTDLLCFLRSEFDTTAHTIFEKIIADVDWAFSVSKSIIDKADDLMRRSTFLFDRDPTQLSEEQLGQEISSWLALRQDMHSIGMPWNYVEFENYLFSGYLTHYITERIRERNVDMIAAVAFATLATPLPLSFAQKEELAMLELALQTAGSVLNGEQIRDVLQTHTKQYCWLPFMYLGPAWTIDIFAQRLRDLTTNHSVAELQTKLTVGRNRMEELRVRQEKLLDLLDVDALHRKYIDLAQSFVYTKAYRKDAIYHGFYSLEKYFIEAARRLTISLRQFRIDITSQKVTEHGILYACAVKNSLPTNARHC